MTRMSGMWRGAAVVPLLVSSACGETVDVLRVERPQDEPRHGGASMEVGHLDAGAPEQDASDAYSEDACSDLVDGILTSFSNCHYQNYACREPLAVSDIALLNCDASGLLGDPAIVASTPAEAFEAGSGASCDRLFEAARRTDDPCCLEIVQCVNSAVVVTARACVPDCGDVQRPGPWAASCGDLVEPYDETGLQRIPLSSVGRGCFGQFICDPEGTDFATGEATSSPYGYLFFCGDGRVQVLMLGPQLPSHTAAPRVPAEAP